MHCERQDTTFNTEKIFPVWLDKSFISDYKMAQTQKVRHNVTQREGERKGRISF